MYNLSKDLSVCSSLPFCFMYLLYFLIITLCNILSPNDRVKANPADIVKKIKPIPVIDRAIVADVAPIKTVESIHSSIVLKVL